MPTPFPDDASVLLTRPDLAEATTVARGIVAAATPPEGPTPLQETLLGAMFKSLTGHEIDIADIASGLKDDPLGPEEFARELARRNLAFRSRIVQIMVLTELILSPLPKDIAERVALYAAELSVHDELEDVVHGYAASGHQLACIDFDRNGYLHDFDPQHTSQLHVSGSLTDAWAAVPDDPALATRWASMSDLPTGTLGRGVHDFYKMRGFAFPGSPGSAPPLLAQHDWVHILANYGTRVESEIEVFAFIARANDDMHAFSLLAMIVSLFETGVLASGAGLFEADRGHLSQPGMAVRLADAMRRGALCSGSTDFMGLDWFSLADKPVSVVQAEFAVPSKGRDAVSSGSVGPWDAAGISPFQLNSGRMLAEAEGREYHAPGE